MQRQALYKSSCCGFELILTVLLYDFYILCTVCIMYAMKCSITWMPKDNCNLDPCESGTAVSDELSHRI